MPTPLTDRTIEGKPVYSRVLDSGSELVFAETTSVASYQYKDIAPEINDYFAEVELVSVVNWHQGTNAPENIFCAHSTADVQSGVYGPTSSRKLSALLRALEVSRKQSNLADWKTLAEASHWSGTMVGRPAEELLTIKPPVIDLEIGSSPSSWSNPEAHKVVIDSLANIHRSCTSDPTIVFCGGIHFEPSLSESLLINQAAFNVGLILPNQWLVSGGYDQPESIERLELAVQSLCEPVSGFCYHDNLKGSYKAVIRQAAERLKLPSFNHRKLRDPAFLAELRLNTEVK
ncbi:D-aminoacyl-tRNA deacylase [bacterium]|nr:D-aminoacyl-tRNA deacylase [bacterium]